MTLHATHAPAFDATCADCWSYTRTCPDCGSVVWSTADWSPDPIRPPATDEEPEDPDPVVTVAGWVALAVVIAIVAVIVLVRWPRP